MPLFEDFYRSVLQNDYSLYDRCETQLRRLALEEMKRHGAYKWPMECEHGASDVVVNVALAISQGQFKAHLPLKNYFYGAVHHKWIDICFCRRAEIAVTPNEHNKTVTEFIKAHGWPWHTVARTTLDGERAEGAVNWSPVGGDHRLRESERVQLFEPRPMSVGIDDVDLASDSSSFPETEIERRREREQVLQCIAALQVEDSHKETLRWYVLDGLREQAIAAKAGKRVTQVRMWLVRGKPVLAELFAARLGTSYEFAFAKLYGYAPKTAKVSK